MSIEIEGDLKDILNEYAMEVTDEVNEAAKQTAEIVTKALKNSSPKKTGKYGRSWDKKAEGSTFFDKNYVIFNKKHYRLTHLLEFGHATVNGGRVEAIPHIKQAEDIGIKTFEEEIRKKLNGK